MASSALDGASKYLNNLLLARGFLQDGKAIDFSLLASNENDTFDRSAATARVINLVHDLVLRRDRDAEQREALASTIHNLRNEEAQRVLDLQKLQDKNIQLKNECATAEAQQRTLGDRVKKATAETRELKEQMLKMKSTLDQVRAKCISDVRKRDVELDKLKGHFSGLHRGKKESAAGGMKINVLNLHQKPFVKDGRSSQDNNGSEWCLENETNDFLAAVVNETSTENVALRKIVGDSMKYLRTLTGLDEAQQKHTTETMNAIGIPGQYRDRDMAGSANSAAPESLVPVQQLGSSMSEVLSHCQTILRDPSFVPIEEVQIRDEEIEKLRAGWEKMADRWKEAVTMMSQWRQKMMSEQEHNHFSGTDIHPPFDMERLSGIAAFGRSVAMRPDGYPVLDPIEEEELTSMLMDHHSRIGNQSAISNDNDAQNDLIIHDETLPEPDQTGTPRQPPISIAVDEEESDLELQDPAPRTLTASPAKRGIKLSKPQNQQHQPLSNTNANARKRKSPATASSPRKRRSLSSDSTAYTAQTGEKQRPVPASENSSSITESVSADPLHLDTLTSDISGDEADLFLSQDVPSKESKSKIPRMTVAQKLAAVEAEASEATEVIRMRQATTYAKGDRRGKDRVGKADTKAASKKEVITRKNSVKNVTGEKIRDGKVKKARDRRRSTLTPAELGSLMGR